MTQALSIRTWGRQTRLEVAVLMDVDGTLAGLYRAGKREFRATAIPALALLSQHAPVLLWSTAGAANGLNLLTQFPALAPFVHGCHAKQDFPIHLIDEPFAIDDEGVDGIVLDCHHVVLGETYNGGEDSGLLLEAASIVVARIQSLRS